MLYTTARVYFRLAARTPSPFLLSLHFNTSSDAMASTPPSVLENAPSTSIASTTDISQSSSTDSSITIPWKESDIELLPRGQLPYLGDLERGPSPSGEQEDRIPRPDGGRDAWLFMAGCFVLEGLLWGK